MRSLPRPFDRARLAWWVYLVALGLGFAFVVHSFVGTIVLGVFIYYASRPVYRRVRTFAPSDGLAAIGTILLATVPLLILLTYTLLSALTDLAAVTEMQPGDVVDYLSQSVFGQELSTSLEGLLTAVIQDPSQLRGSGGMFAQGLLAGGIQTLGMVASALLHIGLAFTIAFTLLRDDDDAHGWFQENIAGPDSTAAAYGSVVDEDLEEVFFGNVLFLFAVAVIAAVVYHGFNLVAPAPLTIPSPTLLALLTGAASLIPIIVGKIVYLPVVAYVGALAVTTDGGGGALAFPIGLLVVSFLLLDILPQTFLQPYLAGRQIHTELMMIAYLLGPLLFGWYGVFLLPLLLVLLVEAARVPLVELIHGKQLTSQVSAAESMGANVEDEAQQEVEEASEESDAEGGSPADGTAENEAETDATGESTTDDSDRTGE